MACIKNKNPAEIPDTTDNLIVVNKAGFYQGVLYLSDLLTHAPEQYVSNVMNTKLRGIHAATEQTEVAALFDAGLNMKRSIL